MNVTAFALRRRVLVTVLVLVALGWGVSTFTSMPRREDPEILIRSAKVITRWPGAPATKVEYLVTDVLEDAIARIGEVDEIESTSSSGMSFITVTLDDRVTELDQVWDELRAEIEAVQGDLPSGCGAPFVNSNFGDVSQVCVAVYQVPVAGDEITHPYDDRQLEDFATIVEDTLEQIDSVSIATLYGVRDEAIYLELDSAQWSQLEITTGELEAALGERNIVASGGLIETDTARFLVRPTGELLDPDELRGVVLRRGPDGSPVTLADVGLRVRRGFEEPQRNLTRFVSPAAGARPSVLLGVEMKEGRNVVRMGDEIQRALEGLRRDRLPPDVELTVVNDLPRQVDGLVSSFVENLWQAVVIVLVVALLMTGWRAALVMATAVPLCMVSAIAVVNLFGVQLEQFSIASLIIALGMIVDNAIVVSDNALDLIRRGRSKLEAAIEGAQGLAIPILTSTMTTVGAFLPLATIPGSSGEYIRSLPIVVSTTLLISYVVAMTVTPLLCFYLLKGGNSTSGRQNRQEPVARAYRGAVRTCLARPKRTLLAAAGLVAGSLMLVPVIGTQFFPGGMRDQFFVDVELANGSPLSATVETCKQVEAALLECSRGVVDGEEVERLVSAIEFAGTGGPRMMLTMNPEDAAPHRASFVVNTRRAEDTEGYLLDVRAALEGIPGARIDVERFMLGPAVDNPVAFAVTGSDASLLRRTSTRIREVLAATPGLYEPSDDWGSSAYEVELSVNQEAASLAGVTSQDVADSLATVLSGGLLTTYREQDRDIPVYLRFGREEASALTTLAGVSVEGANGKLPLASIATIREGWQPGQIVRLDRSRTIEVGARLVDGYLAPVVSSEVWPRIREVTADLPPGYRVSEEGEAKESAEGQANMAAAFQVSIVLIFLVLIAQYNSVVKPLVVLAAVPLALVGALLGLLLSGWAIGFMPLLGIVSLAGVVINNSIILIESIEGQLSEGSSLHDAVGEAGARRLRPILLTTLTTIGGLLPLALFGGPMWAGMSYAMIGGLALSTVLTLLVVPTIYVVLVEARLIARPSPATA